MAAAQGSLGSWDARTIVSNMLPLLIVLCLIVLWAGITLEEARELLDEFGLLAIMVPTMVGAGGNLGTILSSRLTTRLHLGTTELDLRYRVLWANVTAVLALAATVFSTLALVAWVIGHLIDAPLPLSALVTISLVSGMSVAVISVVLSIVTTYGSYRLGIDPDDMTVPIVTNVVDVFGMVIFIGVSTLVLT